MAPLKQLASSLPLLPGVYRFWDAQHRILYVGKARKLRKRVLSYFVRSHSNPRIARLVSKIADIEVTVTASEVEALLLEVNLIKSLRPPFNVLFRDDKTYPYLVFSHHPYPRLMFYRGKSFPKEADFFGPYPDARSVHSSLQTLQKVFRLRTCDDHVFRQRQRPCMLYQIGHCSGPCVSIVSQEEYRADVARAQLFLSGKRLDLLESMEKAMAASSEALQFERAAVIRDQILALQKMLEIQNVVNNEHGDLDIVDGAFSGDGDVFALSVMTVRSGHVVDHQNHFFSSDCLLDHDTESLVIRFVLEYYHSFPPPQRIVLPSVHDFSDLAEAMAQMGCASRVVFLSKCHQGLLDLMQKNLVQALDQRSSYRQVRYVRWQHVCRLMGLSEDQRRAECFDISHTKGQDTVGACVTFDHYDFVRSDYRRYAVRGITPGDDVAALYQVAQQHYQYLVKSRSDYPDVVVVDGAQLQLAAVQKALLECQLCIPIVALSKGRSRKTGQETLFFSDGRPPMKSTISDPSLLLLAEIRDEAHRCAVSGHRARRLKKQFRSVLDEIEGLGPKRQQLLLSRFGSIRAIASASVETLAAVPGISHALALRIHEKLFSVE